MASDMAVQDQSRLLGPRLPQRQMLLPGTAVNLGNKGGRSSRAIFTQSRILLDLTLIV
jgi:hypothetical protein